MEIKNETGEMYRHLSPVNLDFLEFVERNPDSLEHSNYKSLTLNDDLFTLQPWPTFISGKTKEIFREAGVKLFDLIKSIPKRVFNNDAREMGAYYGFPEKEVKKQLEGIGDAQLDSLVGRGDFILSPSGPKCLEYNVAASMGGWQIPIWEFMYLNHPITGKFLKERGLTVKNENLLHLFLEHVVKSTLSEVPGCDTEINITFILEGAGEGGKMSTGAYLDKLLKEFLLRRGDGLTGNVFVCDYPHLELTGNCLFFEENRVHALVEMYLGYISPEVTDAFRAGNVCLIDGPVSYLLSTKLNLALLSDHESGRVFTGEEKRIIDAYVPWTRKITPGSTTYRNERIDDLERFMLSNRETLVIKPSVGLGGRGICVGARSSEKEWVDAVNLAIEKKNWLVQELVESSPGLYQVGETGYKLHDMVWGFFVFGSRYCGAWNRVMPREGSKGIINCHQGATVSIVLEVEEGRSDKEYNTDVKTEMIDIVGELSRVNCDFIEFTKTNPESLKLSNYDPLELNDRYYGLQPWPTFLNRQKKEEFHDISIKVCDLIKSLPARLFDNDPGRIGDYYGLPANLVKIQLEGVTDDHLAGLVGRGDFIFLSSGLKCLEFNLTAAVSGWQLPEWESLYLKTPVIDKFLKEYRVKINNDNFLDQFLEHIVRSSANPASAAGEEDGTELNVALVSRGYEERFDGGNILLASLKELYKKKLAGKSLKGDVFACDYKHLEYHNDAVYLRGHRIHSLTELYHGLVPPGVMKAFTAGNLRLMNGPVTGLLSNKFNLALLSENEGSDLFTREEKKTIKDSIPWTRKIIPGETDYRGEKIRLENFLIPNKDKLVIKPSVGLGGEGVQIGQGTSEAQWMDLVENALREKTSLVQELVDSPPSLYQAGEYGCKPHDTVWGVWLFGSLFGGSFVRSILRKDARRVVNAYTGAQISIVFEVDD